MTKEIEMPAIAVQREGVINYRLDKLRIVVEGVPDDMPPGQYDVEHISTQQDGHGNTIIRYRWIGENKPAIGAKISRFSLGIGTFKDYRPIYHNGEEIGAVRVGKYAACGRYKSGAWSVFVSRDSREECQRAMQHSRWHEVDWNTIEYIKG